MSIQGANAKMSQTADGTGAIQVMTTVDSSEAAQEIAEGLVGARLAACVQVIGPMTSTYRWQGAVEVSTEWLCLIKSRAELYPELEAALRDLHPYDVPEILALPVVAGAAPYLDWLSGQVAG